MKQQLTDRQQEILTFIQQFTQEAGYPPTLRQIAKQFDISSTFGVKRHLDALEKKGYLSVQNNASRGISLTDKEPKIDAVQIPIVGRVAAGSPILAIQNIEGSLVIDPTFTRKKEECFALKVEGDSMIKAGINKGDLVIVEPQKNAVNGEIVVAMINSEATVKTFERKGEKIRLLPQNDDFRPIEVSDGDDFELIGKVVGVVRWLK
jgi:repressor LexA